MNGEHVGQATPAGRSGRSLKIIRLLAVVLGIGIAASLPGAGPAVAGTNVWTTAGPFGGDVKALVIDPASPSTLYAGTPFGIFKTTNSGGSWTAIISGLVEPADRQVTALAIDRNNGAIYAGTSARGVFKSVDGGARWTAVNTGLASLGIRALTTFNATEKNPVYAATDSGVFRSNDGGATWTGVNAGITVPSIQTVTFSPNDPNTLYAGTDDGAFKSTDGATSWDPINTGLGTPTVRALAFAATDPSKIYATTSDGMFITRNAGASWSAANTGLPTTDDLKSVAAHPTDPEIAYAGLVDSIGITGGLFKTTNGGASWAPAQTGLPTNPGPLSIVIHPTSPTIVYAGLDGLGVFKTLDSGASWNDANVGLNATFITSLARHPTNANILYATAPTSGVFKSIDGGATWSILNNFPRRGAADVVVGPGNGEHVFVHPRRGRLFRSTDGGASWTEAAAGLPGSSTASGPVSSLAIHPTSGGSLAQTTLFAGTSNQGAFKSTDGGTSWNPSNVGIETQNVLDFAIHPSAPNTVFAALFGDPEVVKSTDGGATWTRSDSGLTRASARDLAIDPTNSSVLYLGIGFQDLAKSTDAGATWVAANTGLPASTIAEALAVHPTRPNVVYAGLTGVDLPPSDGGFSRSLDGGATWTSLNAGLDLRQVAAILVIARADRATVYAGTEGRGVFSIDLPLFGLTVTKAGTGAGTVTSSPSGINCGSDCTETYEGGTVVTLTANPSGGSAFTGWSGACTNTTGACPVTMDAAKTVTATFVPTFSLNVFRQGNGTGTVSSSPAGISCGTDCNEFYPGGTVVTLTATPSGSAVFTGWSGSCTNATGPCQVTMDAARSVTAAFNVVACSPRPRVEVNVANNGDGRLRVTVRATTLSTGAPNRLVELRFEAAQNSNALIDVAGQVGRSGAFEVPLPDRPESVTFFVRRAGPGATQVPLLVVDECSPPWRTFVGAGVGVPL